MNETPVTPPGVVDCIDDNGMRRSSMNVEDVRYMSPEGLMKMQAAINAEINRRWHSIAEGLELLRKQQREEDVKKEDAKKLEMRLSRHDAGEVDWSVEGQ